MNPHVSIGPRVCMRSGMGAHVRHPVLAARSRAFGLRCLGASGQEKYQKSENQRSSSSGHLAPPPLFRVDLCRRTPSPLCRCSCSLMFNESGGRLFCRVRHSADPFMAQEHQQDGIDCRKPMATWLRGQDSRSNQNLCRATVERLFSNPLCCQEGFVEPACWCGPIDARRRTRVAGSTGLIR